MIKTRQRRMLEGNAENSMILKYLGTSLPHAFATKANPETALLAALALLDCELSLQA